MESECKDQIASNSFQWLQDFTRIKRISRSNFRFSCSLNSHWDRDSSLRIKVGFIKIFDREFQKKSILSEGDVNWSELFAAGIDWISASSAPTFCFRWRVFVILTSRHTDDCFSPSSKHPLQVQLRPFVFFNFSTLSFHFKSLSRPPLISSDSDVKNWVRSTRAFKRAAILKSED